MCNTNGLDQDLKVVCWVHYRFIVSELLKILIGQDFLMDFECLRIVNNVFLQHTIYINIVKENVLKKGERYTVWDR